MSLSGIEIASKHHTAATFCVAPIDRLLPKDLHKRFDLVVAIEVIEHLLLPRQLFDRAREALKPGGELIVSTPFHGYWKNLAIALSGKFDSHWHPLRDYGHVKFFSPATLNRLFDEQGFEVKQVKRVGRIPTLARSMMMRDRLPNH
jgi:2-polyprenyl-3-methyl-5-hydroxy-6-metoxy-1,4-benzoquinol methylase